MGVIENAIIALLISIIVTLLTGAILARDVSAGTIGRGFPFMWYLRFQMEGARAQFYPSLFLADIIFAFIVTLLVMAEVRMVKKIRKKKEKDEAVKDVKEGDK